MDVILPEIIHSKTIFENNPFVMPKPCQKEKISLLTNLLLMYYNGILIGVF